VFGIPATPSPISGTTTPCLNSTNLYSITTVPGATSYTWQVTSTAMLSIQPASMLSGGQGTKSVEVKALALGTNLSVWVAASNACGAGRNRNLTPVTITSCVRLEDELSNIDLQVYPNPADNNVNISFNSKVDEKYTINFVDVAGKLIMSLGGTANSEFVQQEIDLQSVEAGIYFVNVQLDSGVKQMTRIVVR
jgi:hypothetical protein